ncbi:fructoselysine 6-kinase [Yeosuana aromativorans]|uniref:Fructoselysine 6-kinase n=1 Tax=Yeosuana aromativorans TaxID=288019 RepID=A0A8J3FLG3_9FLAO|nr:carbohydrate kinase family protein [Yeosuana aromativorans]GGK34312.1 fructoselysine 6-kinase [Yeosuana aromativorans]
MGVKSKKIFVCGGVSYNAVITLPEFFKPKPQTIHFCEYNETIGNTGAGKALSLSKLGFETLLHTLIGADDYGNKVKSYLNQPNLEVVYEVDPKGTERHLNLLNSKGERISIFTNPNSENPIIDYEQYKRRIKSSDLVVINISNYCRNFIPVCKALNKDIWTDLHDYDGINIYHQDFIDASDYIFFSSENIKDYKLFMVQMIQAGKKLVVCTHANNGATAYTQKKEWIYEPALLDFEFVNSNGAGDSFFSGFLFAYSQGKTIHECMKYATIAGALCVNTNELVSENLNKRKLETIYLEYYQI